MNFNRRFIKNSSYSVLSSVLLLSSVSLAFAWTEPTLTPPSGNVSAPINAGATTQSKSGAFSVLGSFGVGTASPTDNLHIGNNGNNSITIGLQASGGSTSHIKFLPSNSQINWQISNNEYILGALEFTPSTAGGNSTFSSPAMLIASDGKVGIGTTSPSQTLSVAGTIYSGSGGFKFPDGTTQTTASGGSSQWTTTGSDIYYTTGKVGIGSTALKAPLQVYSSVVTTATQIPAATGATPLNPMARFDNNRGEVLDIGGQWASPYGIWLQATDVSALGTNYPLLLNPNGGNVGIGTAAPAVNLQVVGASHGQVFKAGYTTYTVGLGISAGGAGYAAGLWNNDTLQATFISRGLALGSYALANNPPADTLVVNNAGIGTAVPGTASATGLTYDTTSQLHVNGSIGREIISGTTLAGLMLIDSDGAAHDKAVELRNTDQNLAFIRINDDGNVEGTSMYIDSSGNVGIGTTAPGNSSVTGLGFSYSAALHVNGSARPSPTFSGTGVDFRFIDTNASVNSKIGDIVYDDQIFKFRGLTDGGGLEFNDPALAVDVNNGSVGIGTATPNGMFVVGGGTASTYNDITFNGATTANYGSRLSFSGGGSEYAYLSREGRVLGGTSNNFLIRTSGATDLKLGTNGADNVTIQSGGNVGIGTTNPGSLLTVNGKTSLLTFTETISATGNSGASATINFALGSVNTITLTANTTLSFSNATAGQSVTIFLKQDATGSRTVTWPTMLWSGGTAPTLTTTANKTDIVTVFYDGTNYFGFLGGTNY